MGILRDTALVADDTTRGDKRWLLALARHALAVAEAARRVANWWRQGRRRRTGRGRQCRRATCLTTKGENYHLGVPPPPVMWMPRLRRKASMSFSVEGVGGPIVIRVACAVPDASSPISSSDRVLSISFSRLSLSWCCSVYCAGGTLRPPLSQDGC